MRVGRNTRSDGLTAHEVRQVGPEAPVGHRPGNSVAIDACGLLEYATSRVHSIRIRGRQFLSRDPRLELCRRVDVYAQQHLGVLRAAILRALTEVQSGLVWFHPHRIAAIWNKICFAR